MDMKSAFEFSLVSFRPNITVSYFHSSINERHVCSPKLSLSDRFSPFDAYLLLLNIVSVVVCYLVTKNLMNFFYRVKIKIWDFEMGDLHHRLFFGTFNSFVYKGNNYHSFMYVRKSLSKDIFCVDTADIVHVLSNYNFSIKIDMVWVLLVRGTTRHRLDVL